jgi:hypothetical protein
LCFGIVQSLLNPLHGTIIAVALPDLHCSPKGLVAMRPFKTVLRLFGLVILIVGFSTSSHAQESPRSDYPDFGSISDIKALKKIYVYAEDADSRALISKMLKGYDGLEVVSGARDAEIILEFSTLTRDVAANRGPYARGASMALKSQMRAILLKPDGSKLIAWSETETLDVVNAFTFSAPNEMNLTQHFIRDLQKARGEKPSSMRKLMKGPPKEKKEQKDRAWHEMP